MWETTIVHSLRAEQTDGILLPYQKLVQRLDAGEDISSALAWVPEGKNDEFSYVTDHVSSDTAIDALTSLRAAAEGMQALGIEVPTSAVFGSMARFIAYGTNVEQPQVLLQSWRTCRSVRRMPWLGYFAI